MEPMPDYYDAWRTDPEWDENQIDDERDDYDIQCERWETETDE